jgi:hypothetical protein
LAILRKVVACVKRIMYGGGGHDIFTASIIRYVKTSFEQGRKCPA